MIVVISRYSTQRDLLRLYYELAKALSLAHFNL